MSGFSKPGVAAVDISGDLGVASPQQANAMGEEGAIDKAYGRFLQSDFVQDQSTTEMPCHGENFVYGDFLSPSQGEKMEPTAEAPAVEQAPVEQGAQEPSLEQMVEQAAQSMEGQSQEPGMEL